MKLYVSNLSYNTDDSSLTRIFESIGSVRSSRVIYDRETGRHRGFGFVEMESQDDAVKAIESLNQTQQDGRTITVQEAKERTERPRSGGYTASYR